MEPILRLLRRRNAPTLLLLGIALYCLLSGLTASVRGLTTSDLLPGILLGGALTLGLVKSRFNGMQAAGLYVPLGIGLGLMRVGGLLPILGRLILSLFQKDEWNALNAALGSLAGRLALWLTGLTQGVQVEDPLTRGLVWSLIAWLLTGWAAWFTLRRRDPLTGLAPALALLAGVINYVRGDLWLVWTQISAALLLMGLTHYEAHLTEWLRTRTDYAESIGQDTAFAVLLVATAALSLAALMATLDPREMLQKWHESTSDQSLAKTFGLEAAKDPGLGQISVKGGLPRRQLVGLPPDRAHDTILIIHTDAPPDQIYWRGATYDTYTGSGWANTPVTPLEMPANAILSEGSSPETFTFELTSPGNIYWPGQLVSIDQPIAALWRIPPPNGDLFWAKTDAKTYIVRAERTTPDANTLRAAPPTLPAEIRARYLALPDNLPERVYDLARDLTASSATPYDRAIAIQAYLRTFPYSTNVPLPPPGRDVADYFLFDLQTGYCDYYATAMTVLARAAGLPARLVAGYATGSYDNIQKRYVVSAQDAHSWVEIYFSGIGWVEFEPTASLPAPTRDEAQGVESALPPPTIKSTLTRLKEMLVTLAIQWLRASLVLIPTLLALFWCYQLLERWYYTHLPGPRAIDSIYRAARRRAAKLLPAPSAHLTPQEFTAALEGSIARLSSNPRIRPFWNPVLPNLNQLSQVYIQNTFTAHPVSPVEQKKAILAWQSIRWRLWFVRPAK